MTDDHSSSEDVGLHSLSRPGSVISRTALGTGWIVGWRFASRALGFISTLFLARLLSPSDFGIVALAMGFMHSFMALSELGTENAIIRDDKHDRAVYDTGFTINVLRGLLVGILVFLLSVPAAYFFKNPHFTHIAWVAAIISILYGFENIGVVDFRRFMAFEYEFMLNFIPRIVSAVTAIFLAYILRNFWALIIALLVKQVISLILSYTLHPYRPQFTLSAWKRIASYSILLWFTGLISLIGNFGTNSIIGRILGMGSVGILELGRELARLPSSELVAPLSRALFPGFSEIRKQGGSGAEFLIRVASFMTLFTLPAGIGISLIAGPLVELTYGAKWLAAIPLIQILGFAYALEAFSTVISSLFSVHGWLNTLIKINSFLVVIRISLLIALTQRYGILGAAFSIAISDLLMQIILLAYAIRKLEITVISVASRIWRSIAASAMMAIVLYKLGLGWISLSGYQTMMTVQLARQLFEAIALGAITYTLSLIVLWLASGRPNGPEMEIIEQLKSLMKRYRAKKTIASSYTE